jgi:hypothetical protein
MRAPVYCLPAVLLAHLAAPAFAEERDFCANRPGIGTPACTMAPGTAMVETGVVEWDHSADAAGSDDSTTFGEFLLRVGVSDSVEVQFGLDSVVHDRQHDSASGLTSHSTGIGDAFFAVRGGLAGPNGPVAVEAFVNVPPDDASQWSAGVLLPVEFDLPSGFQLALTPEVDLTADSDRKGRHATYGGVVGLSHGLAANVTIGGELAAFEDDDPTGHSLDARLAGELAWQVAPRLQVDFEADAGLSTGAPDVAFMIGFAGRFR